MNLELAFMRGISGVTSSLSFHLWNSKYQSRISVCARWTQGNSITNWLSIDPTTFLSQRLAAVSGCSFGSKRFEAKAEILHPQWPLNHSNNCAVRNLRNKILGQCWVLVPHAVLIKHLKRLWTDALPAVSEYYSLAIVPQTPLKTLLVFIKL